MTTSPQDTDIAITLRMRLAVQDDLGRWLGPDFMPHAGMTVWVINSSGTLEPMLLSDNRYRMNMLVQACRNRRVYVPARNPFVLDQYPMSTLEYLTGPLQVLELKAS